MPEIRKYDYVNQPYQRVRAVLKDSAAAILRDATRSASDRARSVAAELRVSIAGVQVAAAIDFRIGDIRDDARGPSGPALHVPITWVAAHHPNFFPQMDAELSVYPLTSTETQIDFFGRYVPPFGVVGSTLDAMAGRRIAEASIHSFVADLTQHLRKQLA
jgi:hypothetical protein